jgi:hypothetical protein
VTCVDRHSIPFKGTDCPLRLDPTKLKSLACKLPNKGVQTSASLGRKVSRIPATIDVYRIEGSMSSDEDCYDSPTCLHWAIDSATA